MTDQAPAGRGDQAKLVELGCDLAGNRGAMLDNLRAGTREEPGQFFGFRRHGDAAQATVRQINGELLRVTTIGLDLIVGRHRHRGRIDDNVRNNPSCYL